MAAIDLTNCNARRATGAALGRDSDLVEIDFEGRTLHARRGESLLAALVAAGELRLRETAGGEFRGPFCGMGVCQECLVEVDGEPSRRACMTTAGKPMRVRRQRHPISAVSAPRDPAASTATGALAPQIAVIGGGPAGLAAAASAARAGADVVLIDERPQPGGQFYKQPLAADDLRGADFDDRQFRDGRALIAALERSGATIVRGAKVTGAFEPLDLVVEHEHAARLVRPQVLIVATGAYETCWPFPGWTLPGVMTTGAAQTLLRSYRVLPGRRVLVAGNGPLNFQVAAELAAAGCTAVTLVEAAPSPFATPAALARMFAASPPLSLKGAAHLAALHRRGVPIHYAQRISRVEPRDTARLAVTVESLIGEAPTAREFDVDAVCLGYEFGAGNELLRALGCRHEPGARGALETVRDEDCLTSRENVLAAGDCTRLGGAPTALAEGRIAAGTALRLLGIAVPDRLRRTIARARSARARQTRFQRALWQVFAPAAAGDAPTAPDTVVCRCEELTLADLQQAVATHAPASMGSLKRLTRAGMGRCQGRYCGTAIARLLQLGSAWPPPEGDLWAPRPPAKPARIAALARLSLPDDA